MISNVFFRGLLAIPVVCLFAGSDLASVKAQPPENNRTEKGQLALVDGRVELKRKGASPYSRVSMGATFHPGDLLKVAPAAKAIVVCADQTTHELKDGIHGLPCKPSNNGSRVLILDGIPVKVNPTRGGPPDPNIPII